MIDRLRRKECVNLKPHGLIVVYEKRYKNKKTDLGKIDLNFTFWKCCRLLHEDCMP